MPKKICVVGAGRWGQNHIRTLHELNALAGIVESDESRRHALAQQYPEARTYASIREAVRADFDGFTIATPADTHFGVAEFILKHRFPVLVEKPLALSAQDAAKLVALANDMGVNLMVGHVMLFHPAVAAIKHLIASGKIGKLEYLYSNRLNLGTVRTEENILWSFAPHDISIFQALIGAKPIEVVSRGGTFLQPGIHDTTMTVLTYPNNIVGHIFVSWLHPFKEHRLVVIGSKGMLSFEDSNEQKNLLFYEKGIDWVEGEPKKREGPTEIIPYEKKAPLTEELRYFIERLEGGEVEVASGKNAIEVLEILERATRCLTVAGNQNNDATAPTAEPRAEPGPNKAAVASQVVTKAYFVHPTSFIDDDVEIGDDTKIWHFSHVQSHVRIGKKCSLGQNVNVGNNVVIGDFVKVQNNVSIYEGVTLENYVFCGPSMVFTNVLEPRSKYPQASSASYSKTLIKEGASLGANSTIVCGHTVGRHALIGAGAVVTGDVPDYALMVGVPARRKGWVCECGNKLGAPGPEYTCSKCQRRYREKNTDQLVPIG